MMRLDENINLRNDLALCRDPKVFEAKLQHWLGQYDLHPLTPIANITLLDKVLDTHLLNIDGDNTYLDGLMLRWLERYPDLVFHDIENYGFLKGCIIAKPNLLTEVKDRFGIEPKNLINLFTPKEFTKIPLDLLNLITNDINDAKFSTQNLMSVVMTDSFDFIKATLDKVNPNNMTRNSEGLGDVFRQIFISKYGSENDDRDKIAEVVYMKYKDFLSKPLEKGSDKTKLHGILDNIFTEADYRRPSNSASVNIGALFKFFDTKNINYNLPNMHFYLHRKYSSYYQGSGLKILESLSANKTFTSGADYSLHFDIPYPILLLSSQLYQGYKELLEYLVEKNPKQVMDAYNEFKKALLESGLEATFKDFPIIEKNRLESIIKDGNKPIGRKI